MKPILLCLHGWGGSEESFTELRAALKNDGIEILTPDLPGFGDEPDPKSPMTVDDYADWVEQWINEQLTMNNEQLWILGHSHGGRIAVKLAYRQATRNKQRATIERLFLCAAAGIRHPRHFKRIVGLTLAKTGKAALSIPGLSKLQPLGKKLLYKLVRVHDYERASDVMQKTLIKVSQEDLKPLLQHIDIPTDIFWGEDDGMTPISDAHEMHRRIRGSKLHIYSGIRHRVHRDKAAEIANVIRGKIQA